MEESWWDNLKVYFKILVSVTFVGLVLVSLGMKPLLVCLLSPSIGFGIFLYLEGDSND